MDYFCATCQKRHPAGDIAADMWSICKEDIKQGVGQVTDRMLETFSNSENFQAQIADLKDALMGFINLNDAELEKKLRCEFALNRSAMEQLQDKQKNGRLIAGTYVVRLDAVYRMYARLTPVPNEDIVSFFGSSIWKDWLNEPVCTLNVRVLLDENGTFMAITDTENGHFEKNGAKLGFRRICSHCGRILSNVSGCAEEIVVALSGSARAGKTSCMVAMMHALMEESCEGVTMAAMSGDETMKYIAEEVSVYYRNCKKIVKTPTDDNVEVPTYSMLLTLQQTSDNAGTQRVLTIVDMPGEFWKGEGGGLTEKFFRKYSGLYMNVDCLWFVSSKASVRLSQINDVPEDQKKRMLDETSESPDEIADPSDLSANLASLNKHMEANGKRMPPCLIILSKPDYIVSESDRTETERFMLFPLDMDTSTQNAREIKNVVRRNSSVPFLGILEKHMYNHSKNVRSYIKACATPFMNAVENHCPDRFYMSLAAYGQTPLKREAFGSRIPTPYHELYPLFWTLMITGATRVFHNVQWQTTSLFGRVETEDGVEAVRYHYDKVDMLLEKAPSRQKKKDLAVIYNDIENNLMTHLDSYSESVINHRRE